jgi:hypothetical protein
MTFPAVLPAVESPALISPQFLDLSSTAGELFLWPGLPATPPVYSRWRRFPSRCSPNASGTGCQIPRRPGVPTCAAPSNCRPAESENPHPTRPGCWRHREHRPDAPGARDRCETKKAGPGQSGSRREISDALSSDCDGR